MVELSVVIPVRNEEDNVLGLLGEIEAALSGTLDFETIFVDDGSDDTTLERLKSVKPGHDRLRIIAHDRGCGQSSAIRSGVLAARGRLIATIDGDGQNDPADIPNLVATFRALPASDRVGMVSGHRQNRRVAPAKKMASRLANAIRSRVLGDRTADTGCALKIFRREDYLRLPYFDNMHRYLTALMMREGWNVRFVPVNDRPRLHGASKYGIWGRAVVSLRDLMGVMWLQRRCTLPGNAREY